MNDDRRGGLRRLVAPGFVLLLCLAVAGCGGTGNVSGKITYKGEPLGGGTVLFVPANGGVTGRGTIGPDGKYTVEKVPAGPVTIAVETKSAQPARVPAGMPIPPPDAPVPKSGPSIYTNPQGQPQGKYVQIPDSYGDPKTSGLEYTVKNGSQPFDIDLK